MVKWLILILAGYALYRLFANDLMKKKKENKQESAAENERKVAAGELVKDPECGAYVAVDGIIYDMTDSAAWKNGDHNGFEAGKDLTDAIKNQSPHGVGNLARVPVVGKLKTE